MRCLCVLSRVVFRVFIRVSSSHVLSPHAPSGEGRGRDGGPGIGSQAQPLEAGARLVLLAVRLARLRGERGRSEAGVAAGRSFPGRARSCAPLASPRPGGARESAATRARVGTSLSPAPTSVLRRGPCRQKKRSSSPRRLCRTRHAPRRPARPALRDVIAPNRAEPTHPESDCAII